MPIQNKRFSLNDCFEQKVIYMYKKNIHMLINSWGRCQKVFFK